MVPLNQPRLSDPQIKDAIVEHLGAEREYSSQRRTAIPRDRAPLRGISQQRRALEIEGPVLAAQLPDPDQRGSRPGSAFQGVSLRRIQATGCSV